MKHLIFGEIQSMEMSDEVVEQLIQMLSAIAGGLVEMKQRRKQAKEDALDLVRWSGDGGR